MSDQRTLRIERVIDAPPPAVFEAWTTPAAMEVWYRDGDGWDARVVEHGTYLEIDPPHRLVVSETLDVDEGGGWADTRLSVVFEEDNGKTRVTLLHENFPSNEARDAALGGWPGFIDRVERTLTAT